jgi:magnesium-transporting ATPase (P-type)
LKLTTNKEEWDSGSELNTMNYSSPVNAKFINNLEYMLNYTTASDVYNNEPCIFKFERAEKSMSPKQFSLKPLSKYFEKAGVNYTTYREKYPTKLKYPFSSSRKRMSCIIKDNGK